MDGVAQIVIIFFSSTYCFYEVENKQGPHVCRCPEFYDGIIKLETISEGALLLSC